MTAHPGDIRTHPLEDCPVCQELGDWASCEDSVEWIEAHETLREIRSNATSCPTCRGTGGGTYNDCPTCGGNGVV